MSESKHKGPNVLLSLACVVVVVAGMKLSSEVCVPIAMGLFLGVLTLPILNFLNYKWKLPRAMALILTVLCVLLVFGGIIYVVSGVIPKIQDNAEVYASRISKTATQYSTAIDKQLEKLANYGHYFGIEQVEGEARKMPTFRELFNQYWDTEKFLSLIGQTAIVERFTSIASKSFFVMILMIFFLSESKRYGSKVISVIREHGPDLRRIQHSGKDIQTYLLLKTAVSMLTGLLAWVTCELMNIEFALLWGVVAFALNFVPVIGSIIAAAPPVALALIMNGFWPAVIVLAAYLAINITIGNVVEPKLLGDSFGISTLVVIVSVLVWGYIWGIAGMFLAVPLTMIVKVTLENTPELRWLAVLIGTGSRAEDDENQRFLQHLEASEGAAKE